MPEPPYKISVIIPIYNAEKFLRRAFNSIQNQTIGFETLQVIFVNDASTDGSGPDWTRSPRQTKTWR